MLLQDPSPLVKSNIERFVWNFMATRLFEDTLEPDTG